MVNKISPGGRGGQKKFKKGINIFSKKGFLRGGTNVAKGGDQKFFFARLCAQIVPPSKQKPSYAPVFLSILFHSNEIVKYENDV